MSTLFSGTEVHSLHSAEPCGLRPAKYTDLLTVSRKPARIGKLHQTLSLEQIPKRWSFPGALWQKKRANSIQGWTSTHAANSLGHWMRRGHFVGLQAHTFSLQRPAHTPMSTCALDQALRLPFLQCNLPLSLYEVGYTPPEPCNSKTSTPFGDCSSIAETPATKFGIISQRRIFQNLPF